MALLDSTVGLIYSIKAEDSDARKSVSDLRSHIDDETSKIEESGKNAFISLGKSIGLTDSQIVSLGKSLPVAGAVAAAIAGIATAAVAAGVELFNLAKQTSDFIGEVSDASQQTGLMVETISALRFGAEAFGSSFEEVTGGITKFTKLIGEAAKGSDEAKNKLKNLGIDPQDAINDLEGAFGKAVKKIYELPPGVLQSNAAMDAFGKTGANLIPFINSFEGDTAKLIAKAKELGVTLSDEDARAADEFGDSLEILKSQSTGLANQFAVQFMPQITGAMSAISKWFAANKETIKDWGTTVGNIIGGVIAAFKTAYKFIEDHPTLFRVAVGVATFGASEYGRSAINALAGLGANNAPAPNALTENTPTAPVDNDGYLADQKTAEERRKELENNAKRDINALLSAWKNYGSEVEKIFGDSFKKLKDGFAESGNAEDFRKGLSDLISWYIAEIDKTGVALTKLENDQADAEKKRAAERDLLRQDQEKRQTDWIAKYTDAQAEAEKTISEAVKKESEKRAKLTEEESSRTLSLRKAQYETELALLTEKFRKGEITERQFIDQRQDLSLRMLQFEAQSILDRLKLAEGDFEKQKAIYNERTIILEKFKQLTIANGKEISEFEQSEFEQWLERELRRIEILEKELELADQKAAQHAATDEEKTNGNGASEPEEEPEGFFGALMNGFKRLAANPDIQNAANTITAFGKLTMDAFDGIANAVGGAVEQWALYGGSVGKALKQALAAELAHIAGVATVNALYATALGFMRLAQWDFVGAGNAFLSAGLWAALAGGTALAARALSGDKDKATNAFGREASSPTGNSSNSRRGSSGAYSGRGDDTQIIEQGRNTPVGGEIKISFKEKPSWFDDMFDVAFHNNGKTRNILKENFGT